MLFKLVCLFLSMQSTWFVVFIMKMLLMWLLVANLFFEVLIHKRTTRFLLVRILYSLMLIIPLLLIVRIVVVVKLIRFNIFIMYCKNNLHSNNFFVYLFSLIKILQINAGEGNQNVDENTEDDFEEEDDSMVLRRRMLTWMMIDLPIFMFSSLMKDIIAFK